MEPSHTPVRAPSRANRASAIGPGAAVCAWASVLVALNLTAHPLVTGVTFAGLAWLAVRSGMRRLLFVSILVGLALLVVVPGVAVVDGSWKLAYADGAWAPPAGSAGWLRGIGASLRIPAQVAATALLVLVPARLVLAGTSRISPRTALLGGLVARLRPLLLRDLRLVRDELESRGLRMGRGVPVGDRLRGAAALWEAAMSGLLDRAFGTAAALETRGYGHADPTRGMLVDPSLDDGICSSRQHDRLIVALSIALVATVVMGRHAGALAPPTMQTFASARQPSSWFAVLAALLGGVLGPIAGWRRSSSQPTVAARATQEASHLVAGPRPTALEVETVSMRYPGAAAPSLIDASIRIEPGELVVLAGASGSGKSTLLDVISGVAPRTTGGHRTGTVRLGEHVLDNTRRAGASRIAAVLQDPEAQVLVGQVAEEVAFGLRHAGLPIDVVTRRVASALDRLAVRHLALRDCATLSGGELQRVLLAAAIALEPALLVLDEPTSQIDASSEARFWDAVDTIRRELRIAVIVAEHRLEHLHARADRVVVFERGRIVATVAPAELAGAAPQLVTDGYRDLAPAPVARLLSPRLVIRFDRIEVGGAEVDRRALLRAVSASIPARSIVTLEGPNGSGKSTLLRTIRGLHRAPGGVWIDGIERGAVGASVRQIAFLSQGAGALLPGRTVRHSVEETCRRLGLDIAPAHVALAAAGLANRIDAHPSELSVGERQRLALVAATAHRPPVWLLDEPTRGMDSAARRWVACHALAHAAAGGVVLVATHDPALAAAVATHRLRLDVRTGPSLLEVQRDAAGRIFADPAVPSPTSDGAVST